MILRPTRVADHAAILTWNAADVQFLAPMDQARLTYLTNHATAVEVIEIDGSAAGFVITFLEGSDYDSDNYGWFSELEPRFHYVDRIVVDPLWRGRGVGSFVYATLAARFPDRPLLAEVNYAPPNPASLAFHERWGFVEVGRRGDQSYGVVLLRRATDSTPPGLELAQSCRPSPSPI